MTVTVSTPSTSGLVRAKARPADRVRTNPVEGGGASLDEPCRMSIAFTRLAPLSATAIR